MDCKGNSFAFNSKLSADKNYLFFIEIIFVEPVAYVYYLYVALFKMIFSHARVYFRKHVSTLKRDDTVLPLASDPRQHVVECRNRPCYNIVEFPLQVFSPAVFDSNVLQA